VTRESMLQRLSESSPLVRDPNSKPHSLGAIVCLLYPVALGWCIEFYDYGCYTTLTNEIEANFFAGMPPTSSSCLVWTIFALGQVARPFGGAILGYVADNYGRRVSIIVATIGMLVATGGIGMMPTARCCGEGWGTFSVVMLCIFRVFQGLFAAGEVGVAGMWAIESVAPHRACFAFAIMFVAGEAGFLGAAGISALLESVLDDQAMLDWGWRIPFLLALLLGIASALLQHSRVEESAEYEKLAVETTGAEGKIAAASETRPFNVFRSLWARHRSTFVLSVLICSVNAGLFYGTTAFIKDYLVTIGVRTTAEAGALQAFMFAVSIPADLICGVLADAYGASRTSVIGVVTCLLFVLPAWLLLVSPGALYLPYIGGLLFVLIFSLAHVSPIVLVAGLFPVETRVTGFGLAYNTAQLVFGGFAAAIGDALYSAFSGDKSPSNSLWIDASPAIWAYVILCCAVAGLAGLRCAVLAGKFERASTLQDERLPSFW